MQSLLYDMQAPSKGVSILIMPEVKLQLNCIQIRAHNTGTPVSSYPIQYNMALLNPTFMKL